MKHGKFLLQFIKKAPIKLIKFTASYLGERRLPATRFNSKRKYRNGLYTIEQIARKTRGRKT